jgi:2-oxoglutarate dehydrogenase E1 component
MNSTTATASVPLYKLSESFINGTSVEYVEQQYRAWKKNPESVHTSWAAYFKNVETGAGAGQAFMAPPTLYDSISQAQPVASFRQTPTATATSNAVADNLSVVQLIDAYRTLGHRLASLDPLGLKENPTLQELEYTSYGLTQADLNKEFYFSDSQNYPFSGQKLSDIINHLRSVYCSTYAVQYMHIEVKVVYFLFNFHQDATQRQWLKERIERGLKNSISKEEKRLLLDRLVWADSFEKFLHKKWGQDKRFGLDGCETLIPGMKTLIDTGADLGVESVVIGMPHRGDSSI